MKKKLMISRQLFIAQIIVVEVLCILTALSFYAYNAYTLKNSEKARLASICSNTMTQIDAIVRTMDELSISITIADGFMPSMRGLATTNDEAHLTQLKQILAKEYLSKTSIYRIAVLSPNGNYVSLGRAELAKAELAGLVETGYWRQTDRRGNSKVLVGPMKDPWTKNDSSEVFSLIRAIHDGDNLLGYIEVQMKIDNINRIYEAQFRSSDLLFAIMNYSGDLFFASFPPNENNEYLQTIKENAAWYPTDSIETKNELISITSSNYTDWKTAVIMPKYVLYKPLTGAPGIVISFVILMGIGISMFSMLIFSQITKPIKKVVEQVEQINLESLSAPFEFITGSYETETLSEAFSTMKTRLAYSFNQEKAMGQMQLKTLMEALQSRIGPHFLYNTLGSIANMCESGNAQQAAEACFNLSDLLRYSSNYMTGLVTIREELDHLYRYLALMKGRYRHRLSYTIHALDRCLDVKILKLTIQPIVENAIKYCLSENEFVEVDIHIWDECEGKEVRILISDNGTGFKESALSGVQTILEQFLKKPADFSLEDAAPRGMGLSGTLMRLYLLFGEEKFSYRIHNCVGEGSIIELCIERV